MGFVLNLSNWHQMCLNHIYCYLFTMYDISLDNKCYNYIYYVFLHVFIEISIFMGIYIYLLKWNVFLQFVFLLYLLQMYLFSFISGFYICIYIYWVGSNFLLFNICTIKFIEGKFYFEGRACYIGKIMPTCIE